MRCPFHSASQPSGMRRSAADLWTTSRWHAAISCSLITARHFRKNARDRVPVPISRSSFLKKLKDKESVDGFSIPVARLPAEREDVTEDISDDDRQALEFPPVRFQPLLKERPLTQAQPLPLPLKASLPQAPLVSVSALGAIVLSEPRPVPTEARPPGSVSALTSAREAADSDPHRALPAITLFRMGGSADPPVPWHPQLDLLNSAADAKEFVAEIESDGRTLLRFGDGEHGAAVSPGMEFTAVYRIGNGVRGNVGAKTLAHLVTADKRIKSVTNPMPAFGGCEPETIEEARQRAPHAFVEEQMRAVTPGDYAMQAARYAGVQRAAGTMRWTGSWHTMFVSVDRLSGKQIDPDFEANLRNHLEPFRMAGVDLEIDQPRPVALELTFRVRVKPDYFLSSVELALRTILLRRSVPTVGPACFIPTTSPLDRRSTSVNGWPRRRAFRASNRWRWRLFSGAKRRAAREKMRASSRWADLKCRYWKTTPIFPSAGRSNC